MLKVVLAANGNPF